MSDLDPDDLDPAAIMRLFKQLAEACTAYSLSRPRGPDNVYEQLNALAMVVALILRGTGNHPKAVDFFCEALEDNLADPDLEDVLRQLQ